MRVKRERVRIDAKLKRQAGEIMGLRIRRWRKLRNLTKADVAHHLDCHWTTVNNIERGPGALTLSAYRLLRLADILEIQVDMLTVGISV